MNELLVTKEMTTTSLIIAEHFNKTHRDVTRAIENLSCSNEFSRLFFRPSEYTNARGKKYRCYEISEQGESLLINRFNGIRYSISAREKDCLSTIEQILGIVLIRQFPVLKYRIDGYDVLNKIAYEIDEYHHKCKSSAKKDIKRENLIKKELGCSFKRVII